LGSQRRERLRVLPRNYEEKKEETINTFEGREGRSYKISFTIKVPENLLGFLRRLRLREASLLLIKTKGNILALKGRKGTQRSLLSRPKRFSSVRAWLLSSEGGRPGTSPETLRGVLFRTQGRRKRASTTGREHRGGG